MSKWEIKNFTDVVFFQEGPGVRNHQYTQTGIKLLNVANLQNGLLDLTKSDRCISENEAYGKYAHFLVDEGDLIIASSGIKVEYFDRKMGFVHKEHLPLCMNTSTIRFKSLDDAILKIRYFMYYLKTDFFKMQLSRQITGSAQLNFGPSHLKQMQIPLPPLDEQKKIADELDKISDLIAKRKSQIGKLDLLVKAKFVEMFGDKDYPKVHASEVCDFITKGTTPKSNEIHKVAFDEGIPYLKVYNLTFNGTLDFFTQPQYINKEVHENHLSRSKVYPNDVLMNIVGPPLGKFAIVPNDFKEYNINQAIAIFRSKQRINAHYLLYSLMQESLLKPLLNLSVGVRQQNLSLQQCRSLKIILPPIALQNQFANFVSIVERQKETMQKALEKLETLYKQRMQAYFE